jgi:hypothetical protein
MTIVEKKQSPSFAAAKEMLPDELHPLLAQMVEEYKFVALKVHGRQLVSPRVIAELILLGWVSPPINRENTRT